MRRQNTSKGQVRSAGQVSCGKGHRGKHATNSIVCVEGKFSSQNAGWGLRIPGLLGGVTDSSFTFTIS